MASSEGTNPSDVFDEQKVRKLVELMNEHELSEIDLRQGEQRMRLRRGPEPAILTATPMPSAVPPVQAAPVPAGEAAPAAQPEGRVITCPMVGTFYASSSPETAPYVKVGDQVGPDTTICIIEAMKVFNEIPAECSGKVLAVLVEPGDAVEFGQPLFRIE